MQGTATAGFDARAAAEVFAATMLALGLLRLGMRAYARIQAGIVAAGSPDGWLHRLLARAPYLSGAELRPALQATAAWVGALGLFGLLNAYVFFVLGLFPPTRPFQAVLLRSASSAFSQLGAGVLAYLPKLLALVLTLIVARYTMALVRFVAARMEAAPTELGFGLPPELIRALGMLAIGAVWVLALIVGAPFLPGLGTQTGQAVALLVGAGITLSSGNTLGNAVAGIVLTAMRPFELGDWIRIGQVEGMVHARRFLGIQVRTIKEELVVVTSQQVLAAPIVNYTALARAPGGLVVHTSLTLGYDLPRSRAEALLLEAARRTEGLLDDPAPFVWITALNDSNVTYQLNAQTQLPQEQGRIRSDLHRHLLDAFAEADAEILSPMYAAVRDGNSRTVPTTGISNGSGALV